MPRMMPSIYVIKGPKGYYTHHEIHKQTQVVLNGRLIGHNLEHKPVFLGMTPAHASQFDSEADAQLLIDNKDNAYGPDGAFEGCTVEENTGV